MHRDLGYYWLRLAIYVTLGLGLGTVFYDIGDSYGSIQVSFFVKILMYISGKLKLAIEDIKLLETVGKFVLIIVFVLMI